MSTLSTQCDELRSMAVSVGLEMLQAATLMMGAADAIDRLAAENAKLRELAHLVAEYVSADQCEGCVTKRACNAGELDMCWIRKAILEKLRKLGVEVG